MKATRRRRGLLVFIASALVGYFLSYGLLSRNGMAEMAECNAMDFYYLPYTVMVTKWGFRLHCVLYCVYWPANALDQCALGSPPSNNVLPLTSLS